MDDDTTLAEDEVELLPKFPPEQLLHTTEEAAELLRVGRTTIYALIKEGALRPVCIGRSRRLSQAELRRYVETLQRGVDEQAPPATPRPVRPYHRRNPHLAAATGHDWRASAS